MAQRVIRRTAQAAVVAAIGAIAMAGVTQVALSDSHPKTQAAPAQKDGPPTTPDERYRAILPVLTEEAQHFGSPVPRSIYSDAARKAGVTVSEIEDWAWKARNAARVSLLTPAEPSLAELARVWGGAWRLDSRIAKGRQTVTDGLQLNQIVRQTDSVLELEVLTIENGISHGWVNLMTGEDIEFAMAAFVKVTATPVFGPVADAAEPVQRADSMTGVSRGGPRAADEPPPARRKARELQVQFKGEIWGSYGEFKQGVPVEMGMRYQNIGGEYTMVGTIGGPSGVGGTDEYEVASWGPGQMAMVVAGMDAKDISTRVSPDARIRGESTRAFWERLRKSNFASLVSGRCKVDDLEGCTR